LTFTVKVTTMNGRSLCAFITLLLLSAGQARPGRRFCFRPYELLIGEEERARLRRLGFLCLLLLLRTAVRRALP
jgi:hypothetical protein